METGLKQDGSLSPLLFNIALEKVVKPLQGEAKRNKCKPTSHKKLRVCDDFHILEDSLEDTVRAAATLEQTKRQI